MKSYYNITITALLLLASCKVPQTLYSQPSSNIAISPEQSEDQKIKDIIAPYSDGMKAAMDEVLGYCPSYIEKSKPSSEIGNFMADAVIETVRKNKIAADLCVLNYGGIRSTLDEGAITVGEIFQIMPFENEITVLELPISYIDTLINFIVSKGGEPMSKDYQSILLIRNQSRDHFTLATNDYMANGGDNYTFLLQATKRIDTGIKVRDALINYVKNHKTLPLDSEIRAYE